MVCGIDCKASRCSVVEDTYVGLIVRRLGSRCSVTECCSIAEVLQRSGVLQRVSVFLMAERGDSSGQGYYFVPVGKLVFSFSTSKQGCVP